jgi:sigma-E factor negative regulatory protein RseA
MSEQIREQVSAFLDGELPNSETELLLKRLTRDGELRESFGRYALIGEAIRGSGRDLLTRDFAGRVNLAIDGEPAVAAGGQLRDLRAPRWWRPFAGAAVAAGVAAVAVVALQQRAIAPTLRPAAPLMVRTVAATPTRSMTAALGADAQALREPISYTVPATSPAAPAAMPQARLANYVLAHSRYSSGLDLRGVMADLLIESDEQPAAINQAAAHNAP